MHHGLPNGVRIGVHHHNHRVVLAPVELRRKSLGIDQNLLIIAVVGGDIAQLTKSRVLPAELIEQPDSWG